MTRIIVIPHEEGWKVIGLDEQKVFKTKLSAVNMAKRVARDKHKPLIIQSKEGKVITVNSYRRNIDAGKIKTANGKRKLSNETVRNLIAEVMSEKDSD